ncbi:uncharacterized protein [Arachis hypogaea]|uniref:Uncharacterized protein n=1 Tax=Arachis hypogaea TaxID=3818 RepID=A0A445DVJ7_ARAHY|nr:hypothetical protein Ahy_A03g013497 [Arachis hypogaea]
MPSLEVYIYLSFWPSSTYFISRFCPFYPGSSASRLHELFIHQFCDAHTCSGKQKPFSRGGKEQSSFFRLAAGALILVLLPVFYLFLYLVQSDMKGQTQELCRISKAGWKVKPS